MRTLTTLPVTAFFAILALAAPLSAVVIEPDHLAEGSDADVRDTDNDWVEFSFLNQDDNEMRIGYAGNENGVVQRIHNRLRFEVPDTTEPGWEFRATAAGANVIGDATGLFDREVDVWSETNLDREGMDDSLLDSIADYAVTLRNDGQLFKDEAETETWPSISFVGSSTVSAEGIFVVDLTDPFNDAINAGADWFEVTMTPSWRAFPSGDVTNRTGQISYFFREPSPFQSISLSASSSGQIVLGDPDDISLPEIVSIPEPATLTLLVLGGVVMMWKRR